MENMKIYSDARAVPKEAKTPITAGRLKGMTDINPMWRIKKLTEVFGPVGLGWYYEITDERIVEGADGQYAAFTNINLFVKHDGEWSKPIVGTGGSMFVANQRNGPHVSDECFKMALTDAISVACKALGFGADVYWDKGATKYTQEQPEPKDPTDIATGRKINKAQKEALLKVADGDVETVKKAKELLKIQGEIPLAKLKEMESKIKELKESA